MERGGGCVGRDGNGCECDWNGTGWCECEGCEGGKGCEGWYGTSGIPMPAIPPIPTGSIRDLRLRRGDDARGGVVPVDGLAGSACVMGGGSLVGLVSGGGRLRGDWLDGGQSIVRVLGVGRASDGWLCVGARIAKGGVEVPRCVWAENKSSAKLGTMRGLELGF